MDCEKFESTMIDELYGELDELTSAAAKRHAGGCARCAARLSGLKATRQVAVLPLVEPPADLEARILDAAREAQKVVPIRGRFSRALSWAGSWAMRPQTAMAALFLLMIGSSALLLRSRAHRPAADGVAMRVSEQGAPAPEEVQAEAPLDSKEASKAHGALGHRADMPAASAASPLPVAQGEALAFATSTPTPAPTTATATGATALDRSGGGGAAGYGRGMARDQEEGKGAAPGKLALNDESELGAPNAGPIGGAPRPRAATPAPPPAPKPGARAEPASPASDPFADSLKKEVKDDKNKSADGDAAGAAYAARNYAEAAKLYDEQARRGDRRAALQAARSVRELSGCSAAVGRFDALASSAWGTDVGYDATLEAGYCHRALGNDTLAQARFSRLLTVPSHAQRAQAGINSLTAVASRKSAAKPAAPPAATATQAPANTHAPAQQQSRPNAAEGL
jgi:hypothetical protein